MKKFSLEQMAAINGGVPKAEYCATAQMIWDNNPETHSIDSWSYVRYLCGIGG